MCIEIFLYTFVQTVNFNQMKYENLLEWNKLNPEVWITTLKTNTETLTDPRAKYKWIQNQKYKNQPNYNLIWNKNI